MGGDEEEDLASEAGLIGTGSSDEEDEGEMSGLEFDSNPSEGGPGEGEEESRVGGGVKEKDEAGGAGDKPDPGEGEEGSKVGGGVKGKDEAGEAGDKHE